MSFEKRERELPSRSGYLSKVRGNFQYNSSRLRNQEKLTHTNAQPSQFSGVERILPKMLLRQTGVRLIFCCVIPLDRAAIITVEASATLKKGYHTYDHWITRG